MDIIKMRENEENLNNNYINPRKVMNKWWCLLGNDNDNRLSSKRFQDGIKRRIPRW